MKVYIVMTERPYEGSWIEEVFLSPEEAYEFITNDKNKTNDELVIKEKEVESNDIFITIGNKELIFFDIVIRNKIYVCIDYNLEIFMEYLESNLGYVIDNEDNYIVSKKLFKIVDELRQFGLRYERKNNLEKLLSDLKVFSDKLGLIMEVE